MKTILNAIFFAGMTIIFLSSCSVNSKNGGDKVQAPVVPLSCIVVLPAITSVGEDETIGYDKANSLQKGARYVDSVLQNELAGHTKVKMLTKNQLANLVPGIEGGLSGTVSLIGQKVNCEGVLVTTVQRFKQREGTELAADSPAVAEFKMVLRHSKNGAVLWSTEFSETQDSFFSNIFSFDKMQSRGFRWVSVEQLMEQGISERLSDCPYL